MLTSTRQLLHILLLLFTTTSTSAIKLIVDRPTPGELFNHDEPVQIQVRLVERPHHQLTNLTVCFIYGTFADYDHMRIPSTFHNIDPNNHHCFAPGLLSGTVANMPRGYYRLGIYLKQLSMELTHTYIQIVDYRSSDVASSVWSCPSDAQCQKQLVDLVRGPLVYDMAAAAKNGHGIHVAKGMVALAAADRLVALAEKCTFDRALDTIDQAPAVQVDLWHRNAGVPAPTLPSLALAAEVYRSVMPAVLEYVQSMEGGWEERNITCTDAFLRRYRPGERLGVKAHADTSDITVNCLLSSSETDYVSGFVYRWVSATSIDIVPTRKGDCVIHPGQVRHGAVPTEEGTRYTLIMFWTVKEKLQGSTSYEPVKKSSVEEEVVVVEEL